MKHISSLSLSLSLYSTNASFSVQLLSKTSKENTHKKIDNIKIKNIKKRTLIVDYKSLRRTKKWNEALNKQKYFTKRVNQNGTHQQQKYWKGKRPFPPLRMLHLSLGSAVLKPIPRRVSFLRFHREHLHLLPKGEFFRSETARGGSLLRLLHQASLTRVSAGEGRLSECWQGACKPQPLPVDFLTVTYLYTSWAPMTPGVFPVLLFGEMDEFSNVSASLIKFWKEQSLKRTQTLTHIFYTARIQHSF